MVFRHLDLELARKLWDIEEYYLFYIFQILKTYTMLNSMTGGC